MTPNKRFEWDAPPASYTLNDSFRQSSTAALGRLLTFRATDHFEARD